MMKLADISGGNTITYAEWYDLMHHYYIAPPTLETCVAHPLDSARVMLKGRCRCQKSPASGRCAES